MERKIYALLDPNTNEIRYIGQTKKSLEERCKNHFKDRKQNKNKNNYTANWISKLYEEFKLKPLIKLIEENISSDEELNNKELFWINFYFKQGCKLTNTSLARYYRLNCYPKFKNGKKVYCYDKEYNLKNYTNSRQAEDILKIHYKKISKAIINKRVCENYCFSYKELSIEEIKEIFNKNHKRSKIKSIDLNTEIERVFNDQIEASKYFKCNFRNINLVLKGKRKTCANQKWEYLN